MGYRNKVYKPSNLGKKIKTFAKVIMIVGMACCLIGAAYTLIGCYDRNGGWGFLEYATINGGVTNPYLPSEWEMKGNDIYNSIQIAVSFGIGFFSFLLGGLPLYWFGCLFERVEHLQSDIADLRRELNKP